jgi:small subunit ribosomal protein S20
MPNSASADKRLRQNHVRRDRNRAIGSNLRKQLRKVREAISAGDADTSANELRLAVKKLDRAAGRNIIHANKAARTKSRLAKAVKAMSTV